MPPLLMETFFQKYLLHTCRYLLVEELKNMEDILEKNKKKGFLTLYLLNSYCFTL